MNRSKKHTGTVFLRATATWVLILLLAPVLVRFQHGPSSPGVWMAWEAGFHLVGWLGVLVPYAVFAGGLAVGCRSSVLSTVRYAAPVGLAAYLLVGFAAPQMEYRAELAKGLPVETRHPTGPGTVSNLLSLRELVRERQPTEVRYSVETPLETPPTWYTYLIHQPAAAALFAILAALLGRIVSHLTPGLSPPVRRNARWAAGLAIGASAFVAQALGGDWVRLDPSNSGLAGAWLPLLVPGLILVVLQLLASRRSKGSTISGSPASDD